jgi:HK97 gp10 family phage protein
MAVTVKVEGLKELDSALGELTKGVARGVLRRTLLKAGAPVVEAAKQFVPEDEGFLKDSIIVTNKAPAGHSVSKNAFAAAMRGGASRAEAGMAARAANRAQPGLFAEAFIGPGRYPYAHMVEFGTEKMFPQPYMRPAWEENKMKTLGIIQSELRVQIDKAAARAARRAAKLAKG